MDVESHSTSTAGLAPLVPDRRGVLPLAGVVVNALSRSRSPNREDLDAPLPASSSSSRFFPPRAALLTAYTANANIAAPARFLAVRGTPSTAARSLALRSSTVTFCGLSFGPNTAVAEFGAFFSFFSAPAGVEFSDSFAAAPPLVAG